MKREFDIALFDGDGTLWDSGDSIFSSLSHAMRTVLRQEIRYEQFIGGLTLEGTFLACMEEEVDPKILRLLTSAYEKHHYENPPIIIPYPGVVETMREIKSAGIRTGIVTTRGLQSLESILDYNRMLDQFDVLVTGDSVKNHKPHPEPVMIALSAFGIDDPRRVVMVGDTDKDINSAKRARVMRNGLGQNGVSTVGVTYGHMQSVEMRKTGADFYADNFPHVGSIILGR
jgi:phosphoglycolate phosphatase-like HAD superfamily hydrolase